MRRSYFDCSIRELASYTDEAILGALAAAHGFALDLLQKDAWLGQIAHLRSTLAGVADGHLFLEFAIPRMGKRVDAVLLMGDTVLVVEYKVGAKTYDAAALRQVTDYALDLKNFHAGSHALPVVPILVATRAPLVARETMSYGDKLSAPICANSQSLRHVLREYDAPLQLDPRAWSEARYKPTPTIVEAAKALYAGHDVREISRSEGGAFNLSATASAISRLIETAKQKRQKTICFVTGVPGSGKTLAGLNLATERMRTDEDEHAVFLSGNGPLVTVLREALARDDVTRAKERGESRTKEAARQKASAFIQNIHHFRDDALSSEAPPVERVVVFDEAQRAWDRDQTSKFMRQRRQQADFNMSEPEFLISVMDRHDDWCVIVCLIGGGQEIHTGEAGILEWLTALVRAFPDWQVAYSPDFAETSRELETLEALAGRTTIDRDLHLGVSVRSFRAEFVSGFIAAVLDGDGRSARSLAEQIDDDYPLVITRDLDEAREWLRRKARGGERFGLVAGSNALRLKAEGVHVRARVATVNWFLNGPDDVRSSYMLEDAATEFEVQGLELDWVCVCWDANLVFDEGWLTQRFVGTRWLEKDGSERQYFLNAYRVLLTRARQGVVVFVPRGSEEDATRPPEDYDRTYEFLVGCGFGPVGSKSRAG